VSEPNEYANLLLDFVEDHWSAFEKFATERGWADQEMRDCERHIRESIGRSYLG